MSGVRVSGIPKGVKHKDIKIHFSKPENGGGPIQEIYYPLFDKEAVVIFFDDHVAEMVMQQEQVLQQTTLSLKLTPVQIFPALEAEVDHLIGEYIQATPEIMDEITISGNVTFTFREETQKYILRGNWYELESAWFYINTLMGHQRKIKDIIVRQTSVEKSKGGKLSSDRSATALTPMSTKSLQEKRRVKMNDVDTITEGLDQMQVQDLGRNTVMSRVLESTLLPDQNEFKRGISRGTNHNDRHSHVSTDTGQQSLTSNESLKSGVKDRKQNSASAEAANTGQHSPKSSRNSNESLKSSVKDFKQNTRGAGAESVVGLNFGIRILKDNPEDLRDLEFVHEDLTVSVYSGDITLEETDALVIGTRPDLINSHGVAAAVSLAAGPSMSAECTTYFTRKGNLEVGKVMHTSAGGRLSGKVKYILHTVGPGSQEITEEDVKRLLTETFLSSFVYANRKLKIQTIACPLISSGTNNVPVEVCISSFLEAILKFKGRLGGKTQHLREIHLVNSDCDSNALCVLQLRQLLTEPRQGTALSNHDTNQNALSSLKQRPEGPMSFGLTNLSPRVLKGEGYPMESQLDKDQSVSTSKTERSHTRSYREKNRLQEASRIDDRSYREMSPSRHLLMTTGQHQDPYREMGRYHHLPMTTGQHQDQYREMSSSRHLPMTTGQHQDPYREMSSSRHLPMTTEQQQDQYREMSSSRHLPMTTGQHQDPYREMGRSHHLPRTFGRALPPVPQQPDV